MKGYGVSAIIHVGLAASLFFLPRGRQVTEATAISIVETAPPQAPVIPPLPPPPVPEVDLPAPPTPAPRQAPPPRPQSAARPRPATPETPAGAAPPSAPQDFGLSAGNGPGLAVAPPAPVDAAAPREPAPPPKHKALAAKPAAAASGCAEPIVKPRPIRVVQPAYTPQAQEAGIEGKVRVEVSISASGEVTAVRVLAGLGHGLDEAAVEAAKASTFEPAMQCGKPVATKFTIGMRFTK